MHKLTIKNTEFGHEVLLDDKKIEHCSSANLEINACCAPTVTLEVQTLTSDIKNLLVEIAKIECNNKVELIEFYKNKIKQLEDEQNVFFNTGAMSIYTPVGSKVVFSFPKNSTDYEQKDICSKLNVGKIYTVKRIDIYSWRSEVKLEEFPDETFNTVFFANYE